MSVAIYHQNSRFNNSVFWSELKLSRWLLINYGNTFPVVKCLREQLFKNSRFRSLLSHLLCGIKPHFLGVFSRSRPFMVELFRVSLAIILSVFVVFPIGCSMRGICTYGAFIAIIIFCLIYYRHKSPSSRSRSPKRKHRSKSPSHR